MKLSSIAHDRAFLKACKDDDPGARDIFMTHSYASEVQEAVYITVLNESWRGTTPEQEQLVKAITLTCIAKIFDEHENLPNRWVPLKKRISALAIAYTKALLRNAPILRGSIDPSAF